MQISDIFLKKVSMIVFNTIYICYKFQSLLILDIHSVVISEFPKIVSEYDQEIPQSQTADNPVAPRGRAAQPSRDTRKTN